MKESTQTEPSTDTDTSTAAETSAGTDTSTAVAAVSDISSLEASETRDTTASQLPISAQSTRQTKSADADAQNGGHVHEMPHELFLFVVFHFLLFQSCRH